MNAWVLAAIVLVLVASVAIARADSDPDRAFWTWFAKNEAALQKAPDLVQVMTRIQAQLRKEPGVLAEVGHDGTKRRLVLTADGDRKVFPTVQRLYAARPKLTGWTVQAFRSRDVNWANEVTTKDRKLAPASLRYLAVRDGDKLDLRMFVPGWRETDKTLGTLVFIVLDHTLGEFDVETKIAGISIHPIDEAPANAHELGALAAEVDALPH